MNLEGNFPKNVTINGPITNFNLLNENKLEIIIDKNQQIFIEKFANWFVINDYSNLNIKKFIPNIIKIVDEKEYIFQDSLPETIDFGELNDSDSYKIIFKYKKLDYDF